MSRRWREVRGMVDALALRVDRLLCGLCRGHALLQHADNGPLDARCHLHIIWADGRADGDA